MQKSRRHYSYFVRQDLPIIISLAVGIIFLGLLIIPSRSYQIGGGSVSSIRTDDKIVALTLDDGPSAVHTTEVLDILSRHDVRATFFLVGKEIDAHPQAAQQIVAEGHEVGNHGYTHRSLIFLTPQSMESEIELTDQAIRETGYVGHIPFRPPYGHKFIALPWYMREQGREVILRNIAPDDDPTRATATEMTQRVMEEISPGSIIVMHVMEDHREQSRRAMDQFIAQLKHEGYRFVTVSELLSYR